jgi:hypothetical protein
MLAARREELITLTIASSENAPALKLGVVTIGNQRTQSRIICNFVAFDG